MTSFVLGTDRVSRLENLKSERPAFLLRVLTQPQVPSSALIGFCYILMVMSGASLFADSEASRQATKVKLSLAEIGEQTRERIRVKITATNEGKEAVTWDSEFSVFMDWQVRTADGKSIKETRTAELERPSSDKFRKRFKTLGPGESVFNEVELTRSVQVFRSGHSQGGRLGEVPTGYEETVRFDIPKRAEKVTISAEYNVKSDDAGGFFVWFGRRFQDVGIPEDRFQSNRLEIRTTRK
jgi:hypothetical protein